MVATAQRPATTATSGLAPVKEPPFRFGTLSRKEHYLKALIYGPYGVGKTVLAGSAAEVPEMRDVLFIDAEAGGLSIADVEGIDSIRIGAYRQITAVHDYLRMHCRARDANDEAALAALEEKVGREYTGKRYRTVIIDSLTEVQKYLMYQIMGIKIGTQPLDAEMAQPQFQDWGQNSEMLRLLVRSFRDLPMNVIFICAEQIIEDDRKVQNRRPALPGKLGGEVQGFLDVVGYYTSGKDSEGQTIRRLVLEPTDRVQAKNRFRQSSVTFVDNPTMKNLFDLARGQ